MRNDIVFTDTLRGRGFTFHTTWGLFSPKHVDDGSRLLIENVVVGETDRILDVGCGYGPMGLVLARQAHRGEVHMVDKDFVAVNYAATNARLNGISNAQAYLSNGLEQVETDGFDLIVSNLPAKVGNELLTIFIEDACAKLKPGGRLVVVTISGLREHIKKEFKTLFGNYKKVKQGKTYTVSMAVKEPDKGTNNA